MNTTLKKSFAFLLCILTLISGLGCSKKNDSEEALKGLTWENEYLRSELETKKAELTDANAALAAANAELNAYRKATPAPVSATPGPVVTPEPEILEKNVIQEVPAQYAFGVACLINGEKLIRLNGETSITAVPALPDGMAFDGWKVNGAEAGKDRELKLTLSDTTLIEAAYHPEKKITCINCYFQFANAKDRAAGDKLETVSFELDYKNPVTKEKCKGGKITGFVQASVPKNKTVDYWIINGVEYHFNNEVKYFRIIELDEATTYEVVFKNAPKKKKTASTTMTDNKVSYIPIN